jgi:hypothetical protein
VDISIHDDDLGSDSDTSPTVTVNNVAPAIDSFVVDSAAINESETVTASGTFTDPALGVATETFTGQATWSDGIITALAVDSNAGTFSTSRTFADDHPLSNTASDDFTVDISIHDDDLGSDSDTSPTVTVNNVAPVIETIVLDSASINETETVIVSGTFSDAALGEATETFSGGALWSDGAVTALSVGAGTFTTSRTFPDDHPRTGTPSDNFTVDITINDDDLGSDTETSPTLTVNNVNPVTSINSITDETGKAVGTGVRVVLMNTEIDLLANFTDVGTQDTHVADVDWGDGSSDYLGSTTGSIAASHVYTEPGVYKALLEVTDDDTGVGPATASITVVDAAGATDELLSQLKALAAAPNLDRAAIVAINDAIAELEGQKGDQAASGALDLLAKGNLNAALVKMWQAMQSLEAAEAADPSLDLASLKSLLALTAKSAAMTAIVEADAAATKRNEMRKVDDAYDLIDDGDDLLAALNYVAAVDKYREAAQEIQGIVK